MPRFGAYCPLALGDSPCLISENPVCSVFKQKIDRKGRGALADVYLGEHIYLKRPCAIKMLHLHLSEKAMKAFLNEACTIAGLDHPHIVRVLDYGVENGTPFLVYGQFSLI